MNPAEWAELYARQLWPVAPAHSVVDGFCSCNDRKCQKNAGKHPRTQHGLKDATADISVLRAWWDRWPTANVLIRTGPVMGRWLVVLDIDPRNGGDAELERLEQDHGNLPRTPRVRTGGGGEHVYFWCARRIGCSQSQVGRGIDVKGEGGYVIAPPSTHVSGVYEWTIGPDTQLAELPEWIERLAATPEPKVAPAGDIGSAIPEGGRNAALISMAGSMRRKGAAYESILVALRSENALKCRPPLDDREVDGIARSGSRYAPEGSASAPGPWNLGGVQQILAPLPPVPWVCEEFRLAPGFVTLVGGYGYSGKTAALQSLAVSVASGAPVWGKGQCRQGKAIHIDYEQGPRLTNDRYQRLVRGMGVELSEGALTVASLPSVYLDSPDTESLIESLVSGFTVCIVDSFRAAFPGVDENDSKVRRHLDVLSRVSVRTGCQIVVILHAGKPADGRGGKFSLRGSSALFDAGQAVFVFNGEKGQPPVITHEKCRIVGTEIPDFGLRFVDAGMGHDPRWGLRVEHIDSSDVQVEKVRRNDAILGKKLIELLMCQPGLAYGEIRKQLKWNGSQMAAAIRSVGDRLDAKMDGSMTIYRLNGKR